ncbi:MAG: hypothetical protein ACI3YE_06820, partial [Candidatus Avispirillum sp.]
SLRHGIRRATSLYTREAKEPRRICGCGANLQMSEVSVGFQPRHWQRLSAAVKTSGFAGGFDCRS